jgi:hypothetical protein
MDIKLATHWENEAEKEVLANWYTSTSKIGMRQFGAVIERLRAYEKLESAGESAGRKRSENGIREGRKRNENGTKHGMQNGMKNQGGKNTNFSKSSAVDGVMGAIQKLGASEEMVRAFDLLHEASEEASGAASGEQFRKLVVKYSTDNSEAAADGDAATAVSGGSPVDGTPHSRSEL